MMSMLTLLAIAALVALSGAVTSWKIRGTPLPDWHDAALGLPIGALLCAFILMCWTVLAVRLTGASLLLPHGALIIGLSLLPRRNKNEKTIHRSRRTVHWSLVMLASGIIVCTTIGSFAHAVLLPTFQYDSLTNWTMRSKISWMDGRLAFDATEDRGMAKPQYPILFHALQITANAGATQWSDRSANTIHWLLSLSTLFALWGVVRQRLGGNAATVVIGLMLSVPLFALHLWQGYADVTLTGYLVLSLVFMESWRRDRQTSDAIVSGIFVASAVWTKSEGLVVGALPWTILMASSLPWRAQQWRTSSLLLLVGIVPALLWPLFALLHGMLLTPHSNDASFALHAEAMKEILPALFSRGSFGVTWFAALLMTLASCTWYRQFGRQAWRGIVWGWSTALSFMVIYTMTPNARFLLNGESFYRQMMVAALLLIAAFAVMTWDDDGSNEDATLAACTQPSLPKNARVLSPAD